MEGFIGTTEQQPQNAQEDKAQLPSKDRKPLCSREPMEGVGNFSGCQKEGVRDKKYLPQKPVYSVRLGLTLYA